VTELSLRQKRHLSKVLFGLDMNDFWDDVAPPAVTETVAAFAAELSASPPMIIKMLPFDDDAIHFWPADGVRAKVRARGGSVLYGWRLREWRKIVLTAEFHAIWVDPEGTLIDITCPANEGDTTLFVPCPGYSETDDLAQRPLNRYHVLAVQPDLPKLVTERLAQLKPSQRAYETRRAEKAGQTLEEWIPE
jgi:hypothetical protein